MTYTKLIVEKQDNICTVKINNPEALNALNSVILKELDAAFTAISEDDSIDVVILTGEGRSFVAGADFALSMICTNLQRFVLRERIFPR